MKDLILVAASGLAREALAAVRATGSHRPVGFLDDDPDLAGRSIAGLPVLGGIARIVDHPDAELILCVGRGAGRERLAECLGALGVAGQLNAIDIAAGFKARGHELVVFGRPGPLVERIRDLGPEFTSSPDPGSRPSLAVVRALVDLARERRIDVIHGYEWPPGVESWLASERLGHGTACVITLMSMAVAPFLPRSVPLAVGTEQIAAVERARGRTAVEVIEPPVDLAHDGSRDPGAERDWEQRFGGQGVLSTVMWVTAQPDSRSPSARQPPTGEPGLSVSYWRGSWLTRAPRTAPPMWCWSLLTQESLPDRLWEGCYGVGPGADRGPKALRAALRPLLESVDLRNELGALGRRVVEGRFSLESAVTAQSALYERAVRSGPSRAVRTADGLRTVAGLGSYLVAERARRILGRARAEDLNSRPVSSGGPARPVRADSGAT